MIDGFDLFGRASAYLVVTVLLVIFLYAYIVYLYRAQRKGLVDYEKYSDLVLNDDINDELLESRHNKEDKKRGEK
ncbi:cytochrome c oxidase, cbb3-type, CcoQ subunit [Helicobacter sp. 11S02629-2]|uniref:cytochrome c oxidase, cbb3-type, CcoQ subunit n=1 Tax=Helicobacter sp. 11S02629-2 TaxID=1476195 RepID=UPI0015DAD99F|nr:cytochrome c oxidase, cbb3-type, CcoQ subunit [Helicobacter sp. 11S02629-2]